MSKKIYAMVNGRVVTFAAQGNIDEILKIGVELSWVDSRKAQRFITQSFIDARPFWTASGNCNDPCREVKTQRTFDLRVRAPSTPDKASVDALLLEFEHFYNDVRRAIIEGNTAGGSLPPATLTFDGTAVI